jgi:anti-sigma B factor antagonist
MVGHGGNDEFAIATTVTRASALVAVRGDLDVATAPTLRTALAEASSATHALVVDVSGVTFMDASALGVLIGAARGARDRGHKVVLRGPSANTLRLLQVTGLLEVFRVEPSHGVPHDAPELEAAS